MRQSIRLVVVAIIVLAGAAGTSAPRAGEVFSADGLTIAYDVEGSGETALVFIHGWSCDSGYWRNQVPHFSESYTVVTVDLAGHGRSGVEREVWSTESFGGDVVAVVEALGNERVILVGHSMGGPVALEAARVLGDRVRAIIGIDTFQKLGLKAPEEIAGNLIKSFEKDFQGTTRGFVASMFPPGADSALVAWVVEDMSSATPEVGIEVLRANFAHDPAPALREISVPIYGINGSLFPVDVETGRQYAETFEVRIMDGLGHFPMLEDPEGFNEILGEIVELLLR